MKKTDKMSRTISQIEHMYNSLNEDFWNGELPIPVITVQSAPGTAGHASVARIWQRKDDDAFELNISAEALQLPIEETIDTLLHEMTHIYCRLHNIKECSGAYHNGKFKEIAEAHGLTCYRTERYGWNTKPDDNLIEYALEKGWTEIQIGRKTLWRFGSVAQGSGSAQLPGEKRPSSTRKLVCPCCKQSVRATKTVNIICGDCMEKMLEA